MAKEKEKDIFGVPTQKDNTSVNTSSAAETAAAEQAKKISTETMGEPVGPRLRATKRVLTMRKKVKNDMFGVASEAAEEEAGARIANAPERIPADANMPENEVKPPKKEEEE